MICAVSTDTANVTTTTTAQNGPTAMWTPVKAMTTKYPTNNWYNAQKICLMRMQ